MRANFHKLLMSVLMIVFYGSNLDATHIRGGEIKVEMVECVSRKVKITLVVYRDIGSPIAIGGGEVRFGDGSLAFKVPEGGFDFYNLGNEIQYGEYVIEHYYSAPGSYIISYTELNRNEGILNMDASVNTPFYIEAKIVIDPFLGCSSSTPEFLSEPVFEGLLSDTIEYSFAAVSANDDKLRYTLEVPKQDINANVLNYNLPDGVSINPLNGLFTWDTSVGNIAEGEYSFAVKVTQFRLIDGNYYFSGYTVRDVQIILREGTGIVSFSDDVVTNEENRIVLEEGIEKQIKLLLTTTNNVDDTLIIYSELKHEVYGEALNFVLIGNANNDLELQMTLLSSSNIIRDNPYVVSIRAKVYFENGPPIFKDKNYLIYTRDVEEPDLSHFLVTSLPESLNDQSMFKIFPNPASQYVLLSNPNGLLKVSIYSLNGALLKEEMIMNGVIYVGDLKQGAYILTQGKSKYKLIIGY